MPVRGPGGRFLSKQELAQQQQATTTNTKESKMAEFDAAKDGPVFVDELPTVKRKGREGSRVWADRLEPLKDFPGKWAQVYGPTPNPHALINNVRQGAAGVDPDEYSFSGRVLDTVTEVDEEGNEKEVKQGYVFARFDTPEQRAEREEKQRIRAEKRAATIAGNGHDEDDEEYDDAE